LAKTYGNEQCRYVRFSQHRCYDEVAGFADLGSIIWAGEKVFLHFYVVNRCMYYFGSIRGKLRPTLKPTTKRRALPSGSRSW